MYTGALLRPAEIPRPGGAGEVHVERLATQPTHDRPVPAGEVPVSELQQLRLKAQKPNKVSVSGQSRSTSNALHRSTSSTAHPSVDKTQVLSQIRA